MSGKAQVPAHVAALQQDARDRASTCESVHQTSEASTDQSFEEEIDDVAFDVVTGTVSDG